LMVPAAWRARLVELGPLPWLGAAWLAGPVPATADVGATGQRVGGVWWWQIATLVLLVAHVGGVVRARRLAVADELPVEAVGLPVRRRWHAVAVVSWAALATIAAAQAVADIAAWHHVWSFAAAAVLIVVAPRRVVGAEAVRWLGVGTVLLAAWTVAVGVGQLDVLAGSAGFYRFKQDVIVAVAAHNVLAGFLIAGLPAVAVLTMRRRRWWLGLLMVAGALAVCLSRGALVAGAGAVLLCAVVVRDRSLALRMGFGVLLATVGVAGVLASVGAELPAGSDATSVQSRIALWEVALDAGLAAPLVGVGFDGIADRSTAADLFGHEHGHNLPLHAFAVAGLPGLLAVVLAWGGLLAGAWQQLDQTRRTVLVTSVLALGAQAMIDEVALRPATVGLLALLTVIAAAPREPHLSGAR
jgi:O-antigen ligase